MKKISVIFVACLAVISISHAEPLPNGAVPLKPAEVKALYAGRTMKFDPDCSQGDTGRVVWLKNGVFRGISDLGNKRPWAIYEGRWSVTGNRICFPTTGIIIESKKKFRENRCMDFYRSGNAVYGVVSVSTGTMGACPKSSKKNYWRYRPISKGDLTSPDYDQIRKKLQQ